MTSLEGARALVNVTRRRQREFPTAELGAIIDGETGEPLVLRTAPAICALEEGAPTGAPLISTLRTASRATKSRTGRRLSMTTGEPLPDPLAAILCTGSRGSTEGILQATNLKLRHSLALTHFKEAEAARERVRQTQLSNERAAWRRSQLRSTHEDDRTAWKRELEHLQQQQEGELVLLLKSVGLLSAPSSATKAAPT